ncbi:MAG TPA: transglycosylase family protein [Acidimicrobiales bacterium]|nr:transglycosylase family protein [Acidimicrobiales bacterium]
MTSLSKVRPALVSALAAATSLSVVVASRPAAADQVSSLKAEATAVSQELVQAQLIVGAYQQQYSVASAKVSADARAMAETGQQIQQDEQQIDEYSSEVRKQAVASYMDSGAQVLGSADALFTANEETLQVENEYASVAAGSIDTALDQLRTSQRQLQAQQAELQQQEATDQSDQSRQASYLSQADQGAQQLQAVQSQVTGQLAQAVQAQAAAQEAAAAAAVAAAQRASTSHGGPAGADPALNAFLQCVVQAESGGDYGAVSPNGLYMGAFQFSQSTWNSAAQAAGRPDLVGVPPNQASKADQDTVAVALYSLDGEQPWLGDRCA